MRKKYLWLIVSRDEYEWVLGVFDWLKDAAIWLGVTREELYRVRIGKVKSKRYGVERVEVGEW